MQFSKTFIVLALIGNFCNCFLYLKIRKYRCLNLSAQDISEINVIQEHDQRFQCNGILLKTLHPCCFFIQNAPPETNVLKKKYVLN